MNKLYYPENMIVMKAKIVIAALLVLAVGLLEGYAQNETSADDKILVMKEIESLPENQGSSFKDWWNESRRVEDISLLFGYASYGVPWGTPSLHGATIGFSKDHFMFALDMGAGSLIDATAYDNTDSYNYLKSNSTQGFGFFSVHYYLIRYLSLGVGLGFHSELQKISSVQTGAYDGYSIVNYKVRFENKEFFGFRVGAKAYIPVSDMLSFYLSGDYDVMPSSARKSKLDLGIGFKIVFY